MSAICEYGVWGYKEEEVTRSYKELKEVTGGYKGQQGDPRSYRGVQRGYRVVTGGYRWFQGVTEG